MDALCGKICRVHPNTEPTFVVTLGVFNISPLRQMNKDISQLKSVDASPTVLLIC
jgi:hypothetical protein